LIQDLLQEARDFLDLISDLSGDGIDRDDDRWATTREINDGMLSPRFAPSQRAFVLTRRLVSVSPPVTASFPEGDGDHDGDDPSN
jgi:hypothetical protein